jgi:SAM-dependent methyltransferase
MSRPGAIEFERIYARNPDPWKLATSRYEAAKRDATVAALGSRRYLRALEVGSATGMLTAALAPRCERLTACDFSPFAVATTRRRVAGLPNVEVIRATFPEQVPAAPWDLVVCSEVLYYLDPPAFERAIAWLRRMLRSGATVLAVHWRGPGVTEPLRGDDVHDRLVAALRSWHALDRRRRSYRLDRFDAAAARRPTPSLPARTPGRNSRTSPPRLEK